MPAPAAAATGSTQVCSKHLLLSTWAPTHLGKDQTPKGGTHAEVGLKPKLSPRGDTTKEEKHKPFYAVAQAVN